MRKVSNILLLLAFLMLALISEAQYFTDNSVLKDGTIYKIGVVEDGVYRITFDELAGAGIDVNALNYNKISLFGNVNGMLPEANNASHYDDLVEMDIMVDNNGIVFYGQGSTKWTANGGYYKYQTNYYSDTTFYFLKIDNQTDGRRMAVQPQEAGDYQEITTAFVDRQYHEVDLHNHYHRGRKWFGETVNMDEGSMKFPFVFKNIIPGRQGYVDVSFLGSAASDGTFAQVKVDGVQQGNDIKIAKPGTYAFAVEKDYSGVITPTSDTIEVELAIIATNSASYLGLDYISVNAWRSLRYENEQLRFAFNETSHPHVNLVKIENASDGTVILDVSLPLNPKIQDFTMAGDVAEFKCMLGINSYVMSDESDFMNIKSIKRIDNQNVHALRYAEMLIITDKIFAEQAEAIKSIHEAEDGLVSEIVFVDEIYNEFSAGSLDITAIRNFIKMIYQRSPALKYVLLLGRGTNDYKNVEGFGHNFVPPYEALNSINEINAYVSDDYYGLMDDNEGGECSGLMDIGVGRIPVLTPDEAEAVVRKIRRHIDTSKTMGEWRNEMLLLADDKKNYTTNEDGYEAMIENMTATVNIDKIYTDAYVRQKLSDGSYCYPDVTSSIINKFNEGILMMAYLGHGGVQGLSASNIFRIKDIEKLENYYKMPFVATGTCEFSAFDDASFVSAGEILYKMGKGGAIGMYTSTRPTNAGTNKAIIDTLLRNTFRNENIKKLTMGDIVLLTKRGNINNLSNYVSYVFFGDPALRFTYPEKQVVIDRINGLPVALEVSIAPMDTVHVEGWVANENGLLDASFNGVVYPKLFDNKSTYTTLNNQGAANNVYTFTNYSDVLYDGGFVVKNGRFSCAFPVPRTVNNQNGMARMSFYAMDTISKTDANGFIKNIKIDSNPTVLPDNEGPEIRLSWQEGHLSAEIHDPQGIYHYNSVIGRDLMLQVESVYSYNSLVVNDYYEQTVDDFTSGKLEIDLDCLEVGDNVITLRAWDTHDNSNTAAITVNIAGEVAVKSMKNVMNYPNPFSGGTCFTIDYPKKDVTVDVDIHIYDVAGRLVNALEYKDLHVENLKIDWNGCNASGSHLPAGVYIYKVCLRDSDCCESNTSQRMIIL